MTADPLTSSREVPTGARSVCVSLYITEHAPWVVRADELVARCSTLCHGLLSLQFTRILACSFILNYARPTDFQGESLFRVFVHFYSS